MSDTGMPATTPNTAPQHLRRHPPQGYRQTERRPSLFVWLREIATVVTLALIISALLRVFVVQVFFIPSQSMHPTLLENDRILVSRISAWTGDIQRGDVIVFNDDNGWMRGIVDDTPLWRQGLEFIGVMPSTSKFTLVKRVIGMPGDRVECCTAEGHLTVNGYPVNEPYLTDLSVASSMPFSQVVPEGHLWVMGDNRENSADSRYHQNDGTSPFVSMSSVRGHAWSIMWPIDRWGTLGNREVFADVPAPESSTTQ